MVSVAYHINIFFIVYNSCWPEGPLFEINVVSVDSCINYVDVYSFTSMR